MKKEKHLKNTPREQEITITPDVVAVLKYEYAALLVPAFEQLDNMTIMAGFALMTMQLNNGAAAVPIKIMTCQAKAISEMITVIIEKLALFDINTSGMCGDGVVQAYNNYCGYRDIFQKIYRF
jgi:hypothetical protein